MGYIKIEIGGKERGLKFNQFAVVTMAKYADLDNYEATVGYAMVYGGLKANCYVKREEADFTFEEVCDWVDNLQSDSLMCIYNVFSETQVYQKLVEKQDEPATKKKSRKTVSKI